MVIYRKMSNHYLQNRTDMLPSMPINGNHGSNNTYANRELFLKMITETPQYRREFNCQTGTLDIWFVRPNDTGIKVTISNHKSSSITIQNFSLGEQLELEYHKFNPHGFSNWVNTNLLTPEDLEQQREFRQQEQVRQDALREAHDSNPKKCAGYHICKYCSDEQTKRERFTHRGLGSYT